MLLTNCNLLFMLCLLLLLSSPFPVQLARAPYWRNPTLTCDTCTFRKAVYKTVNCYSHRGHEASMEPFMLHQVEPSVAEFQAAGPRGRMLNARSVFENKVLERIHPRMYKIDPEPYEKVLKDGNEDSYTTKRCLKHLHRLRYLVDHKFRESNGDKLKIFVVDAWEPYIRLLHGSKACRKTPNVCIPDTPHQKGSYHFSGRALDLALYPRRPQLMGSFARLARKAGFAYVYYESKSHIHVSCKPNAGEEESSNAKPALMCLHGGERIQLESGDFVPISTLKIGDRVQSDVDAITLTPQFSPVVAFLDRKPNVVAEFLQITTSNNLSLKLTRDHLIFKRGCGTAPVRADLLRIGDRMITVSANEPSIVIRLESVVTTGAFSPLTFDGTLVVNGLSVSCYAATDYSNLAHFVHAPVRWCNYLWLMWREFVSVKPTKLDSDQVGIHWYSRILLQVALLLERWGLVQFLSVSA